MTPTVTGTHAFVLEYQLDDPKSVYPFSRRLADENGWSYDFAQRVIKEYLRFVYLGMTAGHKVTPSDEVDQVWHLHQIYSEDYWGCFCPEILGRDFHHGPTKGGNKEDTKYKEWYEKTKQSYRQIFGEEPPEDVWPPSEVRFGSRFMRIDINSHLIIRTDDFPIVSRCIVWLLNKIVAIKNVLRKEEK